MLKTKEEKIKDLERRISKKFKRIRRIKTSLKELKDTKSIKRALSKIDILRTERDKLISMYIKLKNNEI